MRPRHRVVPHLRLVPGRLSLLKFRTTCGHLRLDGRTAERTGVGILRQIDLVQVERRRPLKPFTNLVNGICRTWRGGGWLRRTRRRRGCVAGGFGYGDGCGLRSHVSVFDRCRSWALGCRALQETLGGLALLRPIDRRIVGYSASGACARFGESTHRAPRDHRLAASRNRPAILDAWLSVVSFAGCGSSPDCAGPLETSVRCR